jgi:hypothetical protein
VSVATLAHARSAGEDLYHRKYETLTAPAVGAGVGRSERSLTPSKAVSFGE